MVLATFAAYLVDVLLLTWIFKGRSQYVTRTVIITSIFVYPLAAFGVTAVRYHSNLAVYAMYFLSEFVKQTMFFTMEQMINEAFNKIKDTRFERKEDVFRAYSDIAGNLISGNVFLMCSLVIVTIFDWKKIQQLDPYQYMVSMLILPVLFIICYVLMVYADSSEVYIRRSIIASQSGFQNRK